MWNYLKQVKLVSRVTIKSTFQFQVGSTSPVLPIVPTALWQQKVGLRHQSPIWDNFEYDFVEDKSRDYLVERGKYVEHVKREKISSTLKSIWKACTKRLALLTLRR